MTLNEQILECKENIIELVNKQNLHKELIKGLERELKKL